MVPVAAAVAASPATFYVAKHHSAIYSGAASPSGPIATLRVHNNSLPVSLRLTCESKFPNLAISSISNGRRHQQLHACSDELNYQHPSRHFHYREEDMESDESLWILYERWRAHFGIWRSAHERRERFPLFKKRARFIQEFNNNKHNKERGNTCELNMFADMASEEIPTGKRNKVPLFLSQGKPWEMQRQKK